MTVDGCVCGDGREGLGEQRRSIILEGRYWELGQLDLNYFSGLEIADKH